MNKHQEAFELVTEPMKKISGRYKGRVITAFEHMKEEINTLQELVDKEQPKKVVHIHVLKQFGKCPVCNSSVNIRSHRYFCGECGSALDWSKDETND